MCEEGVLYLITLLLACCAAGIALASVTGEDTRPNSLNDSPSTLPHRSDTDGRVIVKAPMPSLQASQTRLAG